MLFSLVQVQNLKRNGLLMIQKHEVNDNVDLLALWDNRKCWVPAYFMHNFFPFLQSTQRSEGFNAMLKRYVNPQNSLFDFARQYSAIQDKILNAENKEEVDTAGAEPELWGYNPVEKQMGKIYTRKNFFRFQRELKEATSYHYQHLGGSTYKLVSLRGRVGSYGERSYIVEARQEDGAYSCDCCKFERDGMLCCHVMRVMTQLGVCEIPRAYILKRWTWDQEATLMEPTTETPTETSVMPEQSKRTMRYAALNAEFTKIAKDACASDDANRIATKHMKAMKAELAAWKKKKKGEAAREGFATTATTHTTSAAGQSSHAMPSTGGEGSQASNSQAVRDPPKSNTKGRPQQKRYQAPMDIAPKKSRKCRFCGSQEYDARTCPAKIAVAAAQEQQH